MILKPRVAQWFELLVPRDSLATALTLLSRTRAVELQARSDLAGPQPTPEMATMLARFRELQGRFGTWWPEPALDGASAAIEPHQRLRLALQPIEDWVARAEPVVTTLESLETELVQLDRLQRYFELAGAQAPRPDMLAGAGPHLRARLWYQVGEVPGPLLVPEGVLLQRVADGEDVFLLAVGVARAVDDFERGLPTGRVHAIPLPSWLPVDAEAARHALQARRAARQLQCVPLRDQLLTFATSTSIVRALADVEFVEWFTTQVPQLELTGRFAWVTGWMRADRAALVTRSLAAARLPHLIRNPDAPAGLEPPVTLQNPGWVAPFEFFVGMLGTPGREEADPSFVLAVLAPMMFGFMFGDVGQGAVLLLLGLALRRRFPALALLVPGGLASIGFGFVFGSVFGREDVLDPLWVQPLAAPLTVLGASLALGVAVIVTGLAIDAFAHAASGLAGRWLRQRAGVVLAYAGALLAVWRPVTGGVMALSGAVALLAGAAFDAASGSRLAASARALGEFAETALQLVVNTVSFLRVGAFALAHAGLSAAIIGLSAAASSRTGVALILVIGNLLVLALEAMVVGIQTTRLVLFEFFIRFLRGTGRAFRPLQDAPLYPTPVQRGPA